MTGPVALALDAPYCVVGQDPAADLKLKHANVHTRHAYFQVIDGHVYGIDLGSRGGTLLRRDTSPRARTGSVAGKRSVSGRTGSALNRKGTSPRNSPPRWKIPPSLA